MTRYKSPQGEVLDIPDKGIRAIESLGWKPVEEKAKEPEKPKRKTKTEE